MISAYPESLRRSSKIRKHTLMKLITALTGITILFAHPTRELSAAEPETAQRQTITGGALQYSLTIPTDWTVTRQKDHFDISTTAKNSGGNFWVGVYALTDAAGDTDQWAELLTQGRFAGVLTRSKKLATIDSHQWAVLTGSVKFGEESLTCRIYAYAEKGSAYGIIMVATPSAWTWHASELLNIATSFKFPPK